MSNYYSSDFKLGVLGGGQLGKMLLTETQKFDIHTAVLDKAADAPCAKICHEFHQGDLMNFEDVYAFGKKVDLLTIEIEGVNVDALEKLENEGLTVYPKPSILRTIQNKATQKAFFDSNNIPTSPFQRFETVEALKSAVSDGMVSIPFVWKSAQFGYDGMGVKIVKSESDLQNLADTECIAEALVPFKNELAVIVARNANGNIKTYPVVEMEFHPEANQVEYVICPARIEDSVAEKATKVALSVAEAFDFVGLLAVEMFQTQDNEILVNEVAPRTHNSGHYSIEASNTSQFEQHVRAVLNLPLGDTASKVAGVMVNLVGAEGHTGEVVYEGMDAILSKPGVTPHIYGKKQTRPFRKMGHVTIIHPDVNEARKLAATVKQTIKVISKS
ncbi:5-(carboxyamino)imidazole ribonucleotide synthase [Urechidicola sp. KH5]